MDDGSDAVRVCDPPGRIAGLLAALVRVIARVGGMARAAIPGSRADRHLGLVP